MATTINKLLRGGAVGTVCLRYYMLRGKRDRWKRVEEWAASEFPDASPQTVRALIERCKRASHLAGRINRAKGDREITGKEERELRGH